MIFIFVEIDSDTAHNMCHINNLFSLSLQLFNITKRASHQTLKNNVKGERIERNESFIASKNMSVSSLSNGFLIEDPNFSRLQLKYLYKTLKQYHFIFN